MAIRIVLIFYLLGVNIFGIILLFTQKRDLLLQAQHREQASANNGIEGKADAAPSEEGEPKDSPVQAEADTLKKEMMKDHSVRPVKDVIILTVAALGGALGIYISMLLMKYKLKNAPFMIILPTLLGLHVAAVLLLWNISMPVWR